jgi:hypothetical protein
VLSLCEDFDWRHRQIHTAHLKSIPDDSEDNKMLFLKCMEEMILGGVQRMDTHAKKSQCGVPLHGRKTLGWVLVNGLNEGQWYF